MSNIEVLENLCVCEVNFVNKYISPESDYPMKNNGRYRCGMLYTIQGTEIFDFSDKKIYAKPDSVLIIPKNEVYRIDTNDRETITITIDFEVSGDMKFRPFCIKLGENNPVRAMFAEALELWQNKSYAQKTMLKSLFYKIISKMITEELSYTNSGNFRKIETAVSYMHNHFYEPDFKIGKLSEIAGMSSRYFEKLFYKEFKLSPRDYVVMQKVELAKELLKSEKNSVTDVAEAVGYNDIYHFSKIFKKQTGISPGEYKKTSIILNKEK